jgi:hypothetical protein
MNESVARQAGFKYPEGSSQPQNPSDGDPRKGKTRDDQLPATKWLRLRDALALSCRRLDRRNAKQEICDLGIGEKILLRGELHDHYIFFDNHHHCSYLMPSNIDWRRGYLYRFDGPYSPRNLHVLNDNAFRAFVSGQPLTKPKPAALPQTTRPQQHPHGGRPEKFAWDDIWIETCRYIHDDGIPATPAELMRHLQQWCENQFGGQPADSTFKPKLRKLYGALRRSDEN